MWLDANETLAIHLFRCGITAGVDPAWTRLVFIVVKSALSSGRARLRRLGLAYCINVSAARRTYRRGGHTLILTKTHLVSADSISLNQHLDCLLLIGGIRVIVNDRYRWSAASRPV